MKEIIPRMKERVEKRWRKNTRVSLRRSEFGSLQYNFEQHFTYFNLKKVLRESMRQIGAYGLKNNFKDVLE